MLKSTHQDQMESTSPPLFHRFQTILGSLMIDFLLPQEHRQNVLIDRVIFLVSPSSVRALPDSPSTIKTLMGGTTTS
jgi:hypothetical protein